MTFFSKNLRIYGYASLCPQQVYSEFDCDQVSEFAKTFPSRSDVYAEECHPALHSRPSFNQIRALIREGKVDILLVPSLFHICSGEKQRMAKFLNFLNLHNVRLMSLHEKIDSRFLNDSAIVGAITDTCPTLRRFQ